MIKPIDLLHSVLSDKPLQQVRPCEAWASAVGWWARTYPGRPIDVAALVRRGGMSRSTAYDYLREYRDNGLVDEGNVPVTVHLQT